MKFELLESGPQCVLDIDLGVLADRIKANLGRDLPWFHRLPEFNKPKGNEPVAIVAGGPSLNQNIRSLRKFDTIVACGSAHDHVVSLGIVPRYCVVSDSSPLVLEWLKTPNPLCTYVISTACDDKVFDHLAGYPVAMWNALGGVSNDVFGDYPAIGGGCTVTLRTICLMILLGYRNQHFFGFDSCYFDDVSHSYVADKGHSSDPSAQEKFYIRVGGPDGKQFLVNAQFLAQATNFSDTVKLWGQYFDATVYGNGVIAEMIRTGKAIDA